ncbi:hypothetical protein [Klebsiella aerogenes]|uniref:hypothetical protein n=1 Tax=Klebsiella aerogenes TaxID=548 RepID=UPI0032DB4AAB
MRSINSIKSLIIFLWIMAILILAGTYFLLYYDNEPEFYCHASVHEYNGNDQILMDIDTTLDKKQGYTILKGKVIYDDKSEHPFYITKFITTQVKNGKVTIRNDDSPVILSRNTDEKVVKNFINHFYTNNEKSVLSQRIQRLEGTKDGRVLYSTSNVPYAVCIGHK